MITWFLPSTICFLQLQPSHPSLPIPSDRWKQAQISRSCDEGTAKPVRVYQVYSFSSLIRRMISTADNLERRKVGKQQTIFTRKVRKNSLNLKNIDDHGKEIVKNTWTLLLYRERIIIISSYPSIHPSSEFTDGSQSIPDAKYGFHHSYKDNQRILCSQHFIETSYVPNILL